MFTLSVLGKDGQEPLASHDSEQVFGPEINNDWGFAQFVAKSKLKSLSRRRRKGCFTIRCVLTVTNEFPPPDLLGHIESMLRDGTSADITIGVGDREFRAHRCLLAAWSPVFRAQFFRPLAEKDMRSLDIDDMEPSIFEMMLHYVYTGSISPCSDDDEGGHSADVMQHLLVAADRYGLESLKTMCEEELCKGMDVETVTARFSLANKHSCNKLKDACLLFMSSSPQVLGVVLEKLNFNDT
jgi:speckle-type POZ protein